MVNYNPVPVMATGDWITAGWVNTYIGANLAAGWVGENSGDMDFYVSAFEKGNLAKPASLGILKNDNTGALGWFTGGTALQYLRKNAGNTAFEWATLSLSGVLHAKANITYNASDQNITNTSYADINGATVNIVTTVPCTIALRAYGVFAVAGSGQRALIQAVINGVGSGDGAAPHTSNPYYIPFAINFYRTSIPAGTITCKLQARANAGANTGIFERGGIEVLAFTE